MDFNISLDKWHPSHTVSIKSFRLVIKFLQMLAECTSCTLLLFVASPFRADTVKCVPKLRVLTYTLCVLEADSADAEIDFR